MVVTLDKGDDVQISSREICITTQHERYRFQTDQLMEVSILKTDSGPKVDDQGLVLSMSSHDTFIIMSENPLYQRLIFEEMRWIFDLDFNNVLVASFSKGKGKFDLYRQERMVS